MQRDLVERAMAGDHEAFSELARLVVRRLYAVARLILRDADRAEDATQEALFVAWRDLRALRDPDRFEAWLHRLLVRECYREARSGRRRTEVEGRVRPIAHVDDPGEMHALRDELERGLARLTVELRTALVLHHYLGYSFPEIGDALGIPTGTAKSRVHRATQLMRAALVADAQAPSTVGGTADMNTDQNGERFPDIDRILADVFAEDAPPSEPPLLIPALLARTALTRQRPAWRIPSRWLPPNVAWRPRTHGRLNTMATPIRIAAAAAAIGVLAVVGGIVPRTTGPGGNELASPSPSPIALPVGGDGATGDLEAGTTYFLDDLWDVGSADLILTVPATGWFHNGGGNIAKDLIADPVGGAFAEVLITPWWRARNLTADPCHWRSGGELDPPVGPTADDLATALVEQAAGNASAPTDVTVGGYPGKRVELSLPAGLDIATCDGGEFFRWWDEVRREKGGWPPAATEQHRVHPRRRWHPLRHEHRAPPGSTSAENVAEMEAMLASIRIELPAPKRAAPPNA